jgi:hypothetical protein
MRLNSGKAPDRALATIDDIRHFLGDLDEALLVQILAIEPTVDQVEQAALWLAGEGDRLSREGYPLEGPVAAIFDILAADEEEPRLSS